MTDNLSSQDAIKMTACEKQADEQLSLAIELQCFSLGHLGRRAFKQLLRYQNFSSFSKIHMDFSTSVVFQRKAGAETHSRRNSTKEHRASTSCLPRPKVFSRRQRPFGIGL
jgi:hypothetical protein